MDPKRAIRAVFRGGVIRPIETVPDHWCDGQELQVEEMNADDSVDVIRLGDWRHELERLVSSLNDLGEWEAIEKALREADAQAKATVRREMGLLG